MHRVDRNPVRARRDGTPPVSKAYRHLDPSAEHRSCWWFARVVAVVVVAWDVVPTRRLLAPGPFTRLDRGQAARTLSMGWGTPSVGPGMGTGMSPCPQPGSRLCTSAVAVAPFGGWDVGSLFCSTKVNEIAVLCAAQPRLYPTKPQPPAPGCVRSGVAGRDRENVLAWYCCSDSSPGNFKKSRAHA